MLFTGDETVQLLRFCTVASGPGNLGMDCLDKIPLFPKSSVQEHLKQQYDLNTAHLIRTISQLKNRVIESIHGLVSFTVEINSVYN